MRKFLSILGILSLITLEATSCNTKEFQYSDLGERPNERTLNFYALNDFHGAYLYDEDYEQIGLSRIGNYLIDKKTDDPENTFIISSGDMFQGGAESNITYGEVVIESMNAIGFDSMTIGNHEFDWGIEKIEEMNEQMNFPLLGINIFYASDNKRPNFLKSSTVVEREGIRVGIIGSIMPGIGDDILATISNQFLYSESIKLIQEEAEKLREIEHCEVVVLSTHDGSEWYYESLADEGYVDAVFLGHDHKQKEGTYKTNNVPYVEGANYGSYLSHISLDLKIVDGTYEVINSTVENIETFGNLDFNDESIEVNNVYATFKKEIESIRDEVLFTFPNTISKNKFGNFIAKCLVTYCQEELIKDDNYQNVYVTKGLMNSGGVRSNIQSGEFTYGDLIRVYPFENVLVILKVKSELYDIIPSSGYLYETENINKDEEYSYVATIDYIAYQNSYQNMTDELITTLITARDIVAHELKTNGYIE